LQFFLVSIIFSTGGLAEGSSDMDVFFVPPRGGGGRGLVGIDGYFGLVQPRGVRGVSGLRGRSSGRCVGGIVGGRGRWGI
jgi:hypothetical protein